MAKPKSAEPSQRQAEKSRARNKATKSAVKGKITQALRALKESDPAKAKEAMKIAESAIDMAVKRKVYHRNAGARRKSRLTKKLNAMTATAGQTAEPKNAKPQRAKAQKTKR